MRGTVLSGSWSTWDGGGRGKRRSETLKVASKCKSGEKNPKGFFDHPGGGKL
jgi:hypothetical protein